MWEVWCPEGMGGVGGACVPVCVERSRLGEGAGSGVGARSEGPCARLSSQELPCRPRGASEGVQQA